MTQSGARELKCLLIELGSSELLNQTFTFYFTSDEFKSGIVACTDVSCCTAFTIRYVKKSLMIVLPTRLPEGAAKLSERLTGLVETEQNTNKKTMHPKYIPKRQWIVFIHVTSGYIGSMEQKKLFDQFPEG